MTRSLQLLRARGEKAPPCSALQTHCRECRLSAEPLQIPTNDTVQNDNRNSVQPCPARVLSRKVLHSSGTHKEKQKHAESLLMQQQHTERLPMLPITLLVCYPACPPVNTVRLAASKCALSIRLWELHIDVSLQLHAETKTSSSCLTHRCTLSPSLLFLI